MNGRAHLILAVPIYVLAVRYLSDASTILLSPFLALYCILTMVGSLFPDVDWVVAERVPGFGHRNPLTHSLLVPLALHAIMGYYKVSDPISVACFDAFTLGVAAHLLGDLVKTGNLVWIKSRRYENKWYVVNGFAVIILLYFSGFFAVSQLRL